MDEKEYIRHFSDINKSHIPVVGGKGANLGEMYAKFAIPEGFCITIHAYEEFVAGIKDGIHKRLADLDVEKTEDLQKVSEEIQELIKNTPIPKRIIEDIKEHHEKVVGFVAVRSSATAEDLPTASFAGQQDTYLNIKGSDAVVEAVRDCWSSLFNARAIYYRVKNNFKHEEVSISVVVQEMVDAAIAGVAFTVNPINQDHNQMVIEGAFGLGETVVSGSITPDTHMVQKEPLKILETHVGTQKFALFQDEKGNKKVEFTDEEGSKRKLTDEQVLEVAREVIKIEAHYAKPQDIEWAFDKDSKLHILQSRPITTLK
ncbi:hypothetical protein GOV07_02030 [Candidatus Woesearchaeota archaeon]|nr:hypothetical protein [Candidatus Woesearchaeota archaeon]